MTDLIFPQPEASDHDEDGRLLASYLGKPDLIDAVKEV